MSSFFSQASFVMDPSVYRAGTLFVPKPTDGSGDLTITRTGDTATRVGPNGYIEKVRTNLALQSQAFNVTWTPVRSSVTANTTTAPDGTSTADTLFDSVDNNIHYVRQSFTAITGPATISIYAKANQLSQIQLVAAGGTTPMARGFDLSTGTTFVESIGGIISNDLGQSITAVGNGWYRCTMSWTSTGQNDFWILTSSANAATYAGTGTNGVFIWGAQLETGDIATDYIPTTTTAVSVGPVANVPRLNYSEGCPSLLLEPQRTNLALWSESFDNAAWTKTAAGTGVAPVVTANSAISPDGYQNADTIVFNVGAGTTSSDQSYINQTLSVTSGSTYTFSVYLKGSIGGEQLIIRSASGSYTLLTLSNEWQRFSVTAAAASTGYAAHFGLRQGVAGTLNSTATVYAYGAQVELGAYATSYIPTLGSASTRGADDFSKTGISSLIGQTEGTLFVDFVPNNTPTSGVAQWLFFLGSGTTYITIHITTTQKIRAEVANTTSQARIDGSSNLVAGTRYKAALAYKENDFAFYVNGVQIGLDTSGTVPALSSLQNNYNTTAANSSNAGLNQALLFKTRLPNSELAKLTSL